MIVIQDESASQAARVFGHLAQKLIGLVVTTASSRKKPTIWSSDESGLCEGQHGEKKANAKDRQLHVDPPLPMVFLQIVCSNQKW